MSSPETPHDDGNDPANWSVAQAAHQRRAERLQELFRREHARRISEWEQVRATRGAAAGPRPRKVTNQEVADFVRRATDQPVSDSWISSVRNDYPGYPIRISAAKLAAIAQFFGETLAYFSDNEFEASVALIESVRDASTWKIAARDFASALTSSAEHMSVEQLRMMTAIVRAIGTDEDSEGPGSQPSA